MKHNLNLTRADFFVPTLSDNKVISLPVDNFPCQDPSFYKQDGFPRTDIGILDRFSTEHMDKELFDIVASRMQELQSNPDDGLSDAQKLRLLKPAYIQTASETAFYEEHVYQILQEMKQEVKVDPSVTDASVPVVEPPVAASAASDSKS